MYRFFNHGQGAVSINLSDPNIKYFNKADGTLGIVYFHNGSWNVATRSVPEANVPFLNSMTFRDLFEKCLLSTTGMDLPTYGNSFLNKDVTYCFEITSPLNTIVVEYTNYKLYFLAARNIITLEELDVESLDIGISPPEKFTFSSIQSILDYVKEFPGKKFEGIVAVDSNFNRVKIKNPNYVIAHRLRDTICASDRNLISAILANQDDDIISLLPQELADKVLSYKLKMIEIFKKNDESFINIKFSTNSRKEFAIAVNKSNNVIASAMFSLYEGKASSTLDYYIKCGKNGTWSNNQLDYILNLVNEYKAPSTI